MELIFIWVAGIKEDVRHVYINNPSIYMCTLFQSHLNICPQIHTHTHTYTHTNSLTVASVLQESFQRNISKVLSCDLEGFFEVISSLAFDPECWCCSFAQLCQTFCDPMHCSTPILHYLLNSYPLNQWCHPTISFSTAAFSSCPQSFPASWIISLIGSPLSPETDY